MNISVKAQLIRDILRDVEYDAKLHLFKRIKTRANLDAEESAALWEKIKSFTPESTIAFHHLLDYVE